MAREKETIILGSGTLYIAEYVDELPELSTIKTKQNEFSKISGGATIEYTPTPYTAKSDDGTVEKTVITDETAYLKCGICTVNNNVLAKMISTARVTEDGGNTIVKIGGADNDNGKYYAILFYHKDKTDGDIAVMIKGKNTAGLTLTFKKDGESILNPEFKAAPCDDEGTLIIYEEITKA